MTEREEMGVGSVPTPSPPTDDIQSTSTAAPTGDGAAATAVGETEFQFTDVELTPKHYHDFVMLKKRIHPHVEVDGMKRSKKVVVQRELAKLGQCTTMAELVATMEAARSRWLRMDLFKAVEYSFEPVDGGSTSDVMLRVELDEKMTKQEFGVFTTDSAVPELRLKLYNIFGRGYSFQTQYVPPSSKVHSWSLQAVTHTPWFGDRLEYSFGQNRTQFALHAADGEKIEEAKAVLEKYSGRTFQTMSLGLHQRQLAGRNTSDLPEPIARDIGPVTKKMFVKHDLHYSNTVRHSHPLLAQMYPLPVQGHDLLLSHEIAGGPLGGDVSKLFQELSVSKYFALHPLLNLSVSARVAGVWSLGEDNFLNDRLFLGWRNVRGFESIGPSTLNSEWSSKADVRRYAAVGGNALWAMSASLNFPLPFFPRNGLLASHVFANAGNLGYFRTREDLKSRWRELFQAPPMSIGAGLVMTQIPLLGGVLPNGRLEFNFQVPIQVTEDGVGVGCANESLFKRMRFGLIWSSTGDGRQ